MNEAAPVVAVRRFRPYPQYRDSGVEWLGEIPAHWKVKKLKAFSSVQLSNVDKKSVEGQEAVRLCNYIDVYYHERITNNQDFMPATATPEQIRRFHLRAGDVLITKDSETPDDIAVPAVVAEDLPGVICGYHLAHVRPFPTEVDGRLLARAFAAVGPRDQFHVAANGITRFGLSSDAIRSSVFCLPPLSEQRHIAAFLDRETAKIDALIAKKERLIELLQEKRVALITRAVTKGLETNLPMRNSGIEWLGQIPAHWAVERARWLFRERDERSKTGEEELLTVSHLTGVTPRSEKDVNMFEAETTEGYKLCFPGDLVINTLWAWMGAMGVAPVKGIVSPAYNVYEPGSRFDPAFVDTLVRVPVFAQEVIRYSKGVWSSRLRLYPEGFFEVHLPVPPIEEQQTIVAQVSAKTGKLDKLRSATERTIAFLKERRIALISAAVTGKIDVRSEGR